MRQPCAARQRRRLLPSCKLRAATVRRPAHAARAEPKLDYKSAGVDINAGNELVQRIKKLNPEIGGFNGMYPFGDSFLVAGTDGVGTKLKLAFECGKHDTIGIDLVAMCVNDIVVCGARPMFFLDYYATGGLDVDVAESVVKGIFEGCRQCGAVLMGGETAEMPGMYTPGEYDLAGFAVGSVAKASVVTGDAIRPGDVLLGLPSSGVHSNGFSLVRKVIEKAGLALSDTAPWGGASLGEALLEPTRIYVNDVLKLHETVGMKGAVHVTGGGFDENIPRVLPQGTGARIDRAAWEVPPVFKWLQDAGGVEEAEMFRTFNMGIGMVLVVAAEDVDVAVAALPELIRLGEVQEGSGVEYTGR